MDNSDILYNRVKSFSVSVPKNFDIKKDKHILQESVQNSLKYLYNTLLDKYYLKTFKYKIDKYYHVSNTVTVILIDENVIDEDSFVVNIKKLI